MKPKFLQDASLLLDGSPRIDAAQPPPPEPSVGIRLRHRAKFTPPAVKRERSGSGGEFGTAGGAAGDSTEGDGEFLVAGENAPAPRSRPRARQLGRIS